MPAMFVQSSKSVRYLVPRFGIPYETQHIRVALNERNRGFVKSRNLKSLLCILPQRALNPVRIFCYNAVGVFNCPSYFAERFQKRRGEITLLIIVGNDVFAPTIQAENRVRLKRKGFI